MNFETQLIKKWFENEIEEVVSGYFGKHGIVNILEIQSLLSETIENLVKEKELCFLSEGFVSELVENAFLKVDYNALTNEFLERLDV